MNTIATSELFWVILAGYVFFVLGAGLFFARNNQSTEDFFFGRKKIFMVVDWNVNVGNWCWFAQFC